MLTDRNTKPVRDKVLTMSRGERLDTLRGQSEGSAAMRLGVEMRLARERLGWPLEAVSEHLRIRQPYLEAIEDGRIEDLPGSAYAVGFVRAYAKVLELDPDEITRRFRAEASDVHRKTELTFPAPVPERGVPALAVVAVGVVLVVGAYAAWYRMSGTQRPGPEVVQIVPDRLTPLVAERTPPQAAPALPLPAAPPEDQPAVAEASPPPDVQSVSPSSAAAAAPPPPIPSSARIIVRARADSWIQVKDARGQVLLNRVLHVGETWPVPSSPAAAGPQPALLLTTGNAGGTELLVDGIAAASLGTDGSVRRDLPLDPQAIRDGKLAANVQPVFRVSPRNQ